MKKEKATEVKCQACKKVISKSQIGLIIISSYLLISSIYGTVELIKNLIRLFD
jgi:hypothetical protein